MKYYFVEHYYDKGAPLERQVGLSCIQEMI